MFFAKAHERKILEEKAAEMRAQALASHEKTKELIDEFIKDFKKKGKKRV